MSTQVTTGLQVRRSVQLTIDDQSVTVAEGETILSACRTMGKEEIVFRLAKGVE